MRKQLEKIYLLFRQSILLSSNDLLHDAVYRRLWSSILISSFGQQITMLALPLTAAILLNASPTQMGVLTFLEILPFALFSLPSGVWLDRVRKLPVYIAGELSLSLAVASVPVAWSLGWLNMPLLYAVAFIIGTVNTTAGTAAQIVLTQIVPRERLIEAHAKNAMATSGSELAGPAAAGVLVKLLGAPLTMLADATLLLTSAAILRGVKVYEHRPHMPDAHFWRDLKEGLRFVAHNEILVSLSVAIGIWQMCYHSSLVVQILFASRILHLDERMIGISYACVGVGSVIASAIGNRISRAIGPGPCLVLGVVICGLGWGLLAMAQPTLTGQLMFAMMLTCFAIGGTFIFINFLALRQAVTPEPMLGRMTSTMRWLTVIPAGPGALIGGWLGEHVSLRASLAFAALVSLTMAAYCWRHPVIRSIKMLPRQQTA